MSKTFKIRQIEDGTYQILRDAVDEWGAPTAGRWFVYDIAATKEEAEKKAK
jgi:hypothetical protein